MTYTLSEKDRKASSRECLASMRTRIKAVRTQTQADLVSASLNRLYKANVFTAAQLQKLDGELLQHLETLS